MTSFSQWIDSKNHGDWSIYIKRLSANDTGLTGGHQVGIYMPKATISAVLPSISDTTIANPEYAFKARITSHNLPEQTIRAIYYNNGFFKGTRNEHRLTKWNTDVSNNPIQDSENTGALIVFAFYVPSPNTNTEFLDVWICKNPEEEDLIENQIGEIIPGSWILAKGDKLFSGFAYTLDMKPSNVEIPEKWIEFFPSGSEIITYLPKVFKFLESDPDKLIIERRSSEYKLFRQIEEIHVLHKVKKGFNSVDEFMQAANSISNRRKSRSGRSLEIHLEQIFNQFKLYSFSTQCKTEGSKRPDFIFPSCAAYKNINFPDKNLRMLAVKTTCKDRWRQILNEASRISTMHLFTLQEGVSLQQFGEMESENVILVVPKPLHKKYPLELREKLLSLTDFINDTKHLYNQ